MFSLLPSKVNSSPGLYILSPPTFLRTLVQALSPFICTLIFSLPSGLISALETLTFKIAALTLHLLRAIPPLFASLDSKTLKTVGFVYYSHSLP